MTAPPALHPDETLCEDCETPENYLDCLDFDNEECERICIYGPFINGFPDGTFRPNENVTRAQFVQMLYNATILKPQAPQNTFPDVSEQSWYNAAVNFLAASGYISGYPDGTFRPQSDITRAEITVILMKKIGAAPTTGTFQTFSDIDDTHWAYGYTLTAHQNGYIVGYPDGTFRPNSNATRAEAVALITRIL